MCRLQRLTNVQQSLTNKWSGMQSLFVHLWCGRVLRHVRYACVPTSELLI